MQWVSPKKDASPSLDCGSVHRWGVSVHREGEGGPSRTPWLNPTLMCFGRGAPLLLTEDACVGLVGLPVTVAQGSGCYGRNSSAQSVWRASAVVSWGSRKLLLAHIKLDLKAVELSVDVARRLGTASSRGFHLSAGRWAGTPKEERVHKVVLDWKLKLTSIRCSSSIRNSSSPPLDKSSCMACCQIMHMKMVTSLSGMFLLLIFYPVSFFFIYLWCYAHIPR